MLSPGTKRNISRIIPFGLTWLLFSIVYSLLERGILGNLDYYPATGVPYNFSSNIFITAASALVSGIIVGTIEILYLNKLFAEKGFLKKIVCKILIYLFIIISFLLITTFIANAIELKTHFFNSKVLHNVWAFFSNFAFWSITVYIASIIAISLFYMEVSEHLGQGVLHNFLTGKYHKPIEEDRIFMFLDMKSSTTIAENIGHIRYFEMLRKYFSDLSAPIIEYSGEIYQYVGDEVIVSWILKKGLQNNNCIQCFFAMKAAIDKQSKKYNDEFGLIPGFKAGLHFGKVTTGEIGVLKKDITFSGDVLNTTSRIQGLCNNYNVDVLISDQLLQQLNLRDQYQIESFGENELRGREEVIKLFTIIQKQKTIP